MNWNISEWRLLNDGQKEILEKLNTVKQDFSLLSSDVASIKNSLLEHKRDVDKLEGQVEILNKEELGAGAGIAIMGYRIAMLFSGAFALFLADHYSWKIV